MTNDKQANLDSLAREMSTGVCLELEANSTQLVMGHGNPDADIVIVGEAPGEDEDRLGLPFVGRAGKFLDTEIQSAGFKREDFYVTNGVKRRPTRLVGGKVKNRPPTEAEKQAYYPFLERELAIIQPLAIIALGQHSTGLFLPDAKISDVRGIAHKVQVGSREVIVVPQFHPSYALFNPGNRQMLIDDFKQAIDLIQRQ